jgi:hypothetical protein
VVTTHKIADAIFSRYTIWFLMQVVLLNLLVDVGTDWFEYWRLDGLVN